MYFIETHTCDDSLRTRCIKVVDGGREGAGERRRRRKENVECHKVPGTLLGIFINVTEFLPLRLPGMLSIVGNKHSSCGRRMDIFKQRIEREGGGIASWVRVWMWESRRWGFASERWYSVFVQSVNALISTMMPLRGSQ